MGVHSVRRRVHVLSLHVHNVLKIEARQLVNRAGTLAAGGDVHPLQASFQGSYQEDKGLKVGLGHQVRMEGAQHLE